MRILQFRDGQWCPAHDLAPNQARDLAWGPTHVWVRLEALPGTSLENLGATFNLHPLAIEDVLNHRQRPKVEDYPDLTFAVVRVPRWDGKNLDWLTLGLFLGPDFLVTASTDAVPELDGVERRLLAAKPTGRTGSIDHVFYLVLDAIVDAYFPILDGLEDHLEELEEGALASPEPHELRGIVDLKRTVSRVRKTVFPMREAMVFLERGDHAHIRPETRLYLRDVADHMTRLAERLEHVREVASLAQESYNMALQNQTNRIVKLLTGVTLVATVPMLIGTLLGMNLQHLPNWDFWPVTLVSLGAMLPLLYVARRYGWV